MDRENVRFGSGDAESAAVAPARRTAERAPGGELREYPGGHFDLYVGETFERVAADQVAFLGEHL